MLLFQHDGCLAPYSCFSTVSILALFSLFSWKMESHRCCVWVTNSSKSFYSQINSYFLMPVFHLVVSCQKLLSTFFSWFNTSSKFLYVSFQNHWTVLTTFYIFWNNSMWNIKFSHCACIKDRAFKTTSFLYKPLSISLCPPDHVNFRNNSLKHVLSNNPCVEWLIW